jgi:chorismate mutase
MISGFGVEDVLLILCYMLLIFNIVKLIKNLRKKIDNEPIKEGMENNDEELQDLEKLLTERNDESKPVAKPKPKDKAKPLPEPANANLISQYTGIARKSGEYNNRIFNKLEDQINRLLMKDYGENYMEILDRFEYLLSLKMLDNTLTVDFDNEKQMLSKIEKINKYGDAKKFIEEMKDIVSLEMPNNGM